MLNRHLLVGGVVLACALAWPCAAQEPQPPAADSIAHLDLPRAVADSVIAFFNDPATLALTGPVRIPAERVIAGDVAVLGGPVVIAGRVAGRLVVINGDVALQPGARVEGDLTVIGGTVAGGDVASVTGETTIYSERLRYVRRGERISTRTPGVAWPEESRTARREGRSDFVIATGQSYNRVEGLPITFGPVIETPGSNPLRLRAMGIYRTESGATLDDLGYYVRAEQFLGGRRAVRVGGTVHSMITPIEDWHLSDLENGLATFLLHRDFRDHYSREGGSVFGRVEPAGTPFSVGIEARWERHGSEPSGSPWALFGEKDWRSQPLVAEGSMSSLALQLGADTRNSRRDPATGWLLRSEIEHAYRSSLTRPAFAVPAPLDIFPPDFDVLPAEPFGRFTAGHVDVRRYNRLGPEARLNLRLLAGGSLDRSRLPPQRQHAFGGEASMPGYGHFQQDCGARDVAGYRADDVGGAPVTDFGRLDRYFPRYGCDAFAMVQAEYRGRLALRFSWDGSPGRDAQSGWGVGIDASPEWVVFMDAGRGWAYGDGVDEPLAMDIGLGLLLDRVGVYAAAPLRGRGGLNLFVRLDPRF